MRYFCPPIANIHISSNGISQNSAIDGPETVLYGCGPSLLGYLRPVPLLVTPAQDAARPLLGAESRPTTYANAVTKLLAPSFSLRWKSRGRKSSRVQRCCYVPYYKMSDIDMSSSEEETRKVMKKEKGLCCAVNVKPREETKEKVSMPQEVQ